MPVMPDREYVQVSVDFDQVGSIQPRAIFWRDGRRFDIESVLSFRPAATVFPGIPGDCYTVIIRGEEKRLFFDRMKPERNARRLGRWWVECPAC